MACSTALATIAFPTQLVKPLNPKTPPPLRASARPAMAFSAAFRRAASAAAPLVIRALGARPSHYSAVLRLLPPRSALPHGPETAAFTHVARFSSQDKEQESDGELLELIDSEIRATEEDHLNRVRVIREEFPFEIQDDQKSDFITLRRKYDENETIEVEVFVPNYDDDEEEEEEEDEDEDGDEKSSSNKEGDKRGVGIEKKDEQDGKETDNEPSLQLNITISKGEGPSLEFCCTTYGDELTIDDMYFKREENHEDDDIGNEGPEFSDLDENLQEAFHKYLERRGISASTISFLHNYILNKERRGYLMWLTEVKRFVEK